MKCQRYCSERWFLGEKCDDQSRWRHRNPQRSNWPKQRREGPWPPEDRRASHLTRATYLWSFMWHRNRSILYKKLVYSRNHLEVISGTLTQYHFYWFIYVCTHWKCLLFNSWTGLMIRGWHTDHCRQYMELNERSVWLDYVCVILEPKDTHLLQGTIGPLCSRSDFKLIDKFPY